MTTGIKPQAPSAGTEGAGTVTVDDRVTTATTIGDNHTDADTPDASQIVKITRRLQKNEATISACLARLDAATDRINAMAEARTTQKF